jgi:hypothetical protein
MLEPAVAAKLYNELPAGGVDIAVIDRQVRHAPALDRVGERAVVLVEERPAEEAPIRHLALPAPFPLVGEGCGGCYRAAAQMYGTRDPHP